MVRKERRLDANADIVQLELEGFSPQTNDRDGIIQLLNQLMPKDSNLYLGGIADFIIAQGAVGTVVKNCSEEAESDADDDNIVFSVTTIISLCDTAVVRSSVVSDLRNFLKAFVERSESSNGEAEVLLGILMCSGSEKPAMLLNERFVNLPPTIASQAVAALPEEVKFLPKEEQPTHLIVLTRALKSETSDELLYIQPEMEMVRKASVAAVQTNVVNKTVDDDDEIVTYIIMAVEFSSIPEILEMVVSTP